MAGTVTHDKFAKDVLQKIDNNILMDENLYKLASQGHDLGMFYKWYNLRLRGKTHSFAIDVIQDNNFQDYVYTYVKYIKDNGLKNNIDVIDFLYGYITHHYLDSKVHPYIIYKTGVYKNTEETKKYLGCHGIYETQIDKIFLNEFYPGKEVHEIFPKHVSYDHLVEIVNNYAFKKVYNNEEYGAYFVDAMNYVYSFLRLFRYDPTKIKLLGYKTIDLLLSPFNVDTKYEFLSFQISNPYTFENLNEKEVWYNPVDYTRHYSSFMELYNEALSEVVYVIYKLEELIKDDTKDASLVYLIVQDISAIHGYECNQKLELKYFK